MKYLLVLLTIILFGCRPFVGSYCYLENPSSDGSVKCDWAQTIIMPTIPESRDNKLFHQHPRVMAKSYVGKMKNNDFHGQGKLIFNDGRSFRGEWKDGKISKGTLITQSGTYVGTFNTVYDKYRKIINWLRHGKGTMTTNNGSKYVGEWKNNRVNGKGTLTTPDGSKYVGEIVNGMYHGQGTFTLPDGQKYVGEFERSAYTYGTFFIEGKKYPREKSGGTRWSFGGVPKSFMKYARTDTNTGNVYLGKHPILSLK